MVVLGIIKVRINNILAFEGRGRCGLAYRCSSSDRAHRFVGAQEELAA